MRRGIIILYLLSISAGVSLANVNPVDDRLKNNTQNQEVEEPQQETDSTEIPEETTTYEMELTNDDLEGYSDLAELETSTPVEVPETNSYYEGDDDSEDTSSSIISFNFLYYLLQKFKFSNSLGY